MTTKPAMFLLIVLALQGRAASQAPADRAASQGSLRQIIPGHYVYTANNAGRLFNGGVVATNEGVLVFDALESEAIARAEQRAIADVIKQPIRYLVSSPFHDPFSKGISPTAMCSRSGTTTTEPACSTRCNAVILGATSSGRGCRTPRTAIA